MIGVGKIVPCVGSLVIFVGVLVGNIVGDNVGLLVGNIVGVNDGYSVLWVGCNVGFPDEIVGAYDGLLEGWLLG